MSKVLVVPDSHLKIEVIEHGLELAKKHRAENIVLLGDYFDDWMSMPSQYDDMLKYLKDIMRTVPNVIALYGNHELSYMGFPCSGHMRAVQKELNKALANDNRFLFCVAIDGVLYSHAGVCVQWLKQNGLITQNELRLKLPTGKGADLLESNINGAGSMDVFNKIGPSRGGNDYPSPLWADLTELIADAAPIKQVVGHTPVKEIENIGRCWFVDVFSNDNICDEYLLVVDGEPTIIHYEENF